MTQPKDTQLPQTRPSQTTPHIVFIVPYRDREDDKKNFLQSFQNSKQHYQWSDEDVKVFFIHQQDTRPFNRGAMKNIGFHVVKNKYPETYKDINLVFNDVDTTPKYPDTFPYMTKQGVVAHYYGFIHALGGIVVIKAGDFEKIGGYPNFWGWGLEDNCLQDRCKNHGLEIDRSIFFPIKNENVLQKHESVYRTISKREGYIYKYETPDTLSEINNLKYQEDGIMIHVSSFSTARQYEQKELHKYDLRRGNRIQLAPGYYRRSWGMGF